MGLHPFRMVNGERGNLLRAKREEDEIKLTQMVVEDSNYDQYAALDQEAQDIPLQRTIDIP